MFTYVKVPIISLAAVLAFPVSIAFVPVATAAPTATSTGSNVTVSADLHRDTAAPAKTVTKCVNKRTGVARVIKPNGKCKKTEKKVRVTVTPAGPKTCATGGACVLGDIGPGGGKIFLDAGSQQPWGRYLEAAPANWNAGGPEPLIAWCDVSTGGIPGAAGWLIGTGETNTNDMDTACAAGAAVLVHSYNGGGQSDWFVPSRDEMKLMTTSRGGKADVGLSPAIYYWTSTQSSASQAVAMDNIGNIANLYKGGAVTVRPIRAF